MTKKVARSSARPRAAHDPIIFRERLVRLLDDCGARVIVLHAPAGYGKTTLARQWLAAGKRPHVWYTASPAAADLAVLCRDVVSAVRRVEPRAGADALDVLAGSRRPNDVPDELAALLAGDLLRWPSETWLVFDDYHHLEGSLASERFVSRLLDQAPLHVLIATRNSVAWSTPRLKLYREVAELTVADLAMSDDEAARVLSRLPNQRLAEQWRRLAHGWPALLGLASFASRRTLPRRELESTLFEYLAQELYACLTDELKEDLVRLSLAPTMSDTALAFVFGERRADVVTEATARGFVTPGAPPELHPLIHQFLRAKARDSSEVLKDARQLALYLIERREYDAAYDIAASLRLPSTLSVLLRASFRTLLHANRVQTLTSWLTLAREAGADDATVHLIDAELALRAGAFDHALQLSEVVARSGREGTLAGRRLLIAARAAYLKSEEERALRYLREAAKVTTDAEDLSELAWVRMLVSNELEMSDTPALLDDFERYVGSDLNLHVRALTGRALLAWRFGDLADVVLDGPSVERLCRHASTHVKSSFLNRNGSVLAAAGRYTEALTLANRQLELAQRSQLDFTVPYGLILKAQAAAGLRHFGAALRAIRDAASLSPDPYVVTNTTAIRARVLCMQHKFRDALAATAKPPPPSATRNVRGDHAAARSLALVCDGRVREGGRLAASVDAITTTKEATRLSQAVEAITFMKAGNHARAGSKLEELAETDFLDPLVAAYRSYPLLLGKLAEVERFRPTLERLVADANDTALAESVGLGTRGGATTRLTRREREVLALLRDGATNRELSTRLSISESTVKVHVNHVFKKLGARSRAEAVSLSEGLNLEA